MSCALTIGTFDGVHLGHQKLLYELVNYAKKSVALVFIKAPRETTSGAKVDYLCPISVRLNLIKEMGVTEVILVDFTKLRHLSATQFLTFVKKRYAANKFVLGETTFIGNDRVDLATITKSTDYTGFDYNTVKLMTYQNEDKPNTQVPSSSNIRKLIKEGFVSLAAKLLGRHFTLYGSVTTGKKRGRELGFPTANLKLVNDGLNYVIPKLGIYASYVKLGNKRMPAACSVGQNPTFGNNKVSIEAHILDFSSDVYGAKMELELVKFLRPEIRYEAPTDLQKQIKMDVEQVRRTLHST